MQKKYRIILLGSSLLLMLIGLIMIYSASNVWALYKFNDSFKYLKQQAIFVIIGIIILMIASKINYQIYYEKAKLILIICIILLVLVLIPGIGVVRNGSQSWFGIGPFGIQPSEAAKLGIILFTAKYLSDNEKAYRSFKGVLPVLLSLALIFLLIMLQPDLGTDVILAMSVISLLFISGVNMKFFYFLGVLGIGGLTGLILIAPYRLARIVSFINPWSDPLGSGFQIIQSLYAIGPGGLLGFGFLNSRQKHFYLPEPQTDFIFSIVCEEFGVLGASLVVFLFFLLCYSGIKLALHQENSFKKYAIFGIIFQMAFQTILNLCVVVGLIPVTGVTLPFLSYGGSSLLITMLGIGIVLNMSKSNNSIVN